MLSSRERLAVALVLVVAAAILLWVMELVGRVLEAATR